jgi:hypothetical protein
MRPPLVGSYKTHQRGGEGLYGALGEQPIVVDADTGVSGAGYQPHVDGANGIGADYVHEILQHLKSPLPMARTENFILNSLLARAHAAVMVARDNW